MAITVELVINRLSMFGLIVAGIWFIIEGSKYIEMKKANPKFPDKLYAAGVLTIFLGILSLIFAGLHFLFPTEIIKPKTS